MPATGPPRASSLGGRPGLLLAPAVGLMLAFWSVPLLFGIVLGFLDLGGERWVGLENYRTILGEPTFRLNLRLSLAYVAGVVGGTVPVAYLAAVLLARLPARGPARSLFLVPWVVPPVVSALIFRAMASPEGPFTQVFRWLAQDPQLLPLQDGRWAMATVILHSVWRSVPFVALFLAAGLTAIPASLFEACEVDGAGRWRRFWHLQLPLTRGHLMIGLILITAFTLQDAETIYALTNGGPAKDTEVLAVRLFKEAFDYGQMHIASAIGGLLMAMGILFMALYLLLLPKGDTAS